MDKGFFSSSKRPVWLGAQPPSYAMGIGLISWGKAAEG